jgi:hypothetical protein
MSIAAFILAASVATAGDHELREGPWLQSIGLTAGAVYTTTGFSKNLVSYGGTSDPASPFVTRGGYGALQAQVGLARWLAVEAFARFGSLSYGPKATPSPKLRPGTDTSSLDPQLGTSKAGSSAGLVARFLPGRVAIDVGFTAAFGGLRPRESGRTLNYVGCCGDGVNGQDGYSAPALVPTLRVSGTGLGPTLSIATGEGFVRSYAPVFFEILAGYRGEDVEVLVGGARGLAARVDVRVHDRWWIGADAQVRVSGPFVESESWAAFVFSTGVTYRTTSFAPP